MSESKGVEKLYCASANQKEAPRSNIIIRIEKIKRQKSLLAINSFHKDKIFCSLGMNNNPKFVYVPKT